MSFAARACPSLIATSARATVGAPRTSFATLREMIEKRSEPFMLLLGTGWGLTGPVLDRSDYILQAIEEGSGYNHLSVRSAAAVMLHELLGIG